MRRKGGRSGDAERRDEWRRTHQDTPRFAHSKCQRTHPSHPLFLLTPPFFRSRPPAHKRNGSLLTRRLAQHDVGRQAEGVAFHEENSHMRAAVVEGRILNCNVLHRVLHPQVHENGFKKKNRRRKKTRECISLFYAMYATSLGHRLDSFGLPPTIVRKRINGHTFEIDTQESRRVRRERNILILLVQALSSCMMHTRLQCTDSPR